MLLCLRACGNRLFGTKNPPALHSVQTTAPKAAAPAATAPAAEKTEPTEEAELTEETEPAEETEPTEETEPAEETEPETTKATGIRPEFKEAMDAYEAFYDEYCSLYEKYMADSTNLVLLAKYTDMLSRLAEMEEKFEAWDSADMTDEEIVYYIEVTARVEAKLMKLL